MIETTYIVTAYGIPAEGSPTQDAEEAERYSRAGYRVTAKPGSKQ